MHFHSQLLFLLDVFAQVFFHRVDLRLDLWAILCDTCGRNGQAQEDVLKPDRNVEILYRYKYNGQNVSPYCGR